MIRYLTRALQAWSSRTCANPLLLVALTVALLCTAQAVHLWRESSPGGWVWFGSKRFGRSHRPSLMRWVEMFVLKKKRGESSLFRIFWTKSFFPPTWILWQSGDRNRRSRRSKRFLWTLSSFAVWGFFSTHLAVAVADVASFIVA